ncbi:Roadblock/LC7 domain-containing protein [Hesseltinella vesiculosa]|uniref:Roadblock/LC7 domain-containing protein n=1 Tax=Hesseltinella vesiculosa TaxID=101127 RepID=A0A1X2G8M6_9FUNG|nr:Roadblock/LC7 domain-containing protein [Hesseltinella vesiculosa]
MLKPKVISQVLRQATRNGIYAALMLTQEGSLLAYAADNDKSVKIYAAISANIWSNYKKQMVFSSLLNTGAECPKFLLVQCQEGSVYVKEIGGMLLCLVAEESVDLGILKAKADALSAHLEEPLLRVVPQYV